MAKTFRDLKYRDLQSLHTDLKRKMPQPVSLKIPKSDNHVVLLVTVIASQASRDIVTANVKNQLITYGLTTVAKIKSNKPTLRRILWPSGGVDRKLKAIDAALDSIFDNEKIKLKDQGVY